MIFIITTTIVTVCIEVSIPPPQKHYPPPPPFLPSSLLNLQTALPLFRQSSPSILVFCEPHVKNQIFL